MGQDDYANWNGLLFQIDEHEQFLSVTEALTAAKQFVTTNENPAFSSLLRKPLPAYADGLPHYGGASFYGEADPKYQALFAWIESLQEANEEKGAEEKGGEDAPALSPLQAKFADKVIPVLKEATCMTAACHGPEAGGIPLHFDLGYKSVLSRNAIIHNYQEVLNMVSLDGDPMQSRLLRKSLPLGAGIPHKGMNFDFYAANPGGGLREIVNWICEERTARVGEKCKSDQDSLIDGFVFINGPVGKEHPFDLSSYVPGSDLYLATTPDSTLKPSKLENLTARLHEGFAVDIRDPAVSRDGTKVAFSMRMREKEGHHLWLLDLVTRDARQLTFGNTRLPGGGLATDRDPTFGPENTIWFSSTRAGVLADQGKLLDAELYSLDLATGAIRRWTYTPHIERKPVFYDIGDEAGGEVGFSVLRDLIPGQARAHAFRFPPNLETEYHQHFGITPLQTFLYDMRELPDGRYVAVAGDLNANTSDGQLAIIDRNLGPEINTAAKEQDAAFELYLPPMHILDAEGSYQDPAPLPDGRLLVVSYQSQTPLSPKQARIDLLEIAESKEGAGPVLISQQSLIDDPAIIPSDPEPIYKRRPVRIDAKSLPDDETEKTAVFYHQGLPMIDALLSNLPPSGAKTPKTDAAFVRLIAHIPFTPTQRQPVTSDQEAPLATTTSLSTHAPSYILGELPLAEDGSFQTRVPVKLPFRVQMLNAERMAVGTMHNRWYYLLPGQILRQGVSSFDEGRRYATLCSACHGNPDGEPGIPAEHDVPDAITGASLTLSRYQGQNPHDPISPPQLGTSTAIRIDFQKDIQPILNRHCVKCHQSGRQDAKLDLSGKMTGDFSAAYRSLLKRGQASRGGYEYVDAADGRAAGSYLIELITGRELQAPGKLPQTGKPHPEDHGQPSGLSEQELLTLIRWIDLGATFTGLPSDMGVTNE